MVRTSGVVRMWEGIWLGMMRPLRSILAEGSGGGGIEDDVEVAGDTAVAIDRINIRWLDYEDC